MPRMYLFSAVLLLISISCFAGFALIGSEVDAEGVLREPFALIPLGYLAFALSALTTALAGAITIACRWRGSH